MQSIRQKVKKRAALLTLVLLLLAGCAGSGQMDAEKFAYIHEAIPDVRYDIRYITANNFLGCPVDGYRDTVAILTHEALAALQGVAEDLRARGYGLIIFDAYRPQKAVDHFVRWVQDLQDTLTRQTYYPELQKDMLMENDLYIARRSSHSRGSTVDLSLYDLKSGKAVDMGSPFDFFGPVSNHGTTLITPRQSANRAILRDAMLRRGFRLYDMEWWHYTFDQEPFPDTYFNFDVK